MEGDIVIGGRTYRIVDQSGRRVVLRLQHDPTTGQQFTTTVPRNSPLWRRIVQIHLTRRAKGGDEDDN